MAGNYEANAEIIHIVCTKKVVKEYLSNPNDEKNVVHVIIHRVASTLQDNPTLPFSCHESEDVFQLCWVWCVETLKAKPPKYNYKTSLFGYLHRVCVNKLLKLKRDKQWRTDISFQNACKKCKHKDTCTRKIKYSDLTSSTPKCKVMAMALVRNQAKHALSVHADYNITEPEDTKNRYDTVDASDTAEFFGERIPDKYQHVLQKLLNGSLTGIPKNVIVGARRWCWRILRKLDPEQAAYFKRIYYNSYQKDARRKERKEAKANPNKPQRPVGRPPKKTKVKNDS